MLKELIKKQDGFLSVSLFGLLITFVLVSLLVLLALFVGTFKKAVEAHGELGAAVEFAVASSAVNTTTGTTDDAGININGISTLNTAEVLDRFIYGYSFITNTAFAGGEFVGGKYNGPIKLIDFYPVKEGEPIPPPPTLPGGVRFSGGTAMQPGYVAVVDVPIWGGGWANLPEFRLTMKQYGVVQAVPVGY